MEVVIATWNAWKYKQIISQLPDFVTPKQVDLDLPEIQTNLLTVISRDKCIQAYKKLLRGVLVDDTWIFFDAYKNFPGALTKYIYEGMSLDGLQKLFENIEDNRARMQCVLSYMDDKLDEPIQFIAEAPWTISFDWYQPWVENPKLPFEYIFVPEWLDTPAAMNQEAWLGEKHHRIRSTKIFAEWLTKNRK